MRPAIAIIGCLLAGCLSTSGKDHCVDDGDCLDGRRCAAEGRCVDMLVVAADGGTQDAGRVDAGPPALLAYGEDCGADDECQSRLCNREPLLCQPACFCSKECDVARGFENCPGDGRYCTNNVYVGIEAVCVYVVSSGSDGGEDDNKLLLNTEATGRIDQASDVDVFTADLIGNRDYRFELHPINAPDLDLSLAVYTHLGLSYRRNTTGAGAAEAFGIPGILKDGRLFFVVEAVSGTGSYSIRYDFL